MTQSATRVNRNTTARRAVSLILGVGLAAGALAACGGEKEDTNAPITTPVPAPSGGAITETVAPRDVATAKPVELDDSAKVGEVEVSLKKLDNVKVEAAGPGEIAGKAVSVRVSIKNGSDKAIDGTGVYVTLLGKDGAPASPTTAKPAAPIEGSIDPGKTAEGVYVFSVVNGIQNPVTVLVNYGADAKVAQFSGELPAS